MQPTHDPIYIPGTDQESIESHEVQKKSLSRRFDQEAKRRKPAQQSPILDVLLVCHALWDRRTSIILLSLGGKYAFAGNDNIKACLEPEIYMGIIDVNHRIDLHGIRPYRHAKNTNEIYSSDCCPVIKV